MTLVTKLFESDAEGKKNLRGRNFEIHYPNALWDKGYPKTIDVVVSYGPELLGETAVYEKREEWLDKRLYRIYYVRVT